MDRRSNPIRRGFVRGLEMMDAEEDDDPFDNRYSKSILLEVHYLNILIRMKRFNLINQNQNFLIKFPTMTTLKKMND